MGMTAGGMPPEDPGMAAPPAPPSGMVMVIHLPHTVDPSLVDQLTSAVHRMGGQIRPDDQGGMEEPPMEDAGMELPPPGGPPAGPPGPPPPGPGEELPPPMEYGNSGIKRPPSLRTPVKKGNK